MNAPTGAKTRKTAKSENQSLGLTSPNFCSRFVSRETSGRQRADQKGFSTPSLPRAPDRPPLQPQDCGYENRRVSIAFSHKNAKKHANPIISSESVSTTD
jgi:hypothetical protein